MRVYFRLGPVGVEPDGPVEYATWPFTKDFVAPFLVAAGPVGGALLRLLLRRLRGPVGGAAPNLEPEAAGLEDDWEGEADEDAAEAANEFNKARGARGGALPDIANGDDGASGENEEG